MVIKDVCQSHRLVINTGLHAAEAVRCGSIKTGHIKIAAFDWLLLAVAHSDGQASTFLFF